LSAAKRPPRRQSARGPSFGSFDTSSARASSVSGTVRPTPLAVLISSTSWIAQPVDYACDSMRLQPARIDAAVELGQSSLADGSFLAVAPQFIVTASAQAVSCAPVRGMFCVTNPNAGAKLAGTFAASGSKADCAKSLIQNPSSDCCVVWCNSCKVVDLPIHRISMSYVHDVGLGGAPCFGCGV
jgi:hypothetical protein